MCRYIAILSIIIILSGCDTYGRSIEPIEVIQTDADIEEAKELLRNAWQPAFDMTVDGITIPRVKVKSLDEFIDSYDFRYVDKYLIEDIYFRSMATYNDENEMATDDNGYFIFHSYNHGTFIPTIHDERIMVTKAYYEESIYDSDHAHLHEIILYVEEGLIVELDTLSEDYRRTSAFKQSDSGRWVLTYFDGTLGYLPGDW